MRIQGAKPTSSFGAVFIVLLWVIAAALAVSWWMR
jgi:hypothetical protein